MEAYSTNEMFHRSIVKALKLDEYLKVLNLFHCDAYDIHKMEFQRAFCNYFAVRNNKTWRTKFFAIVDEYRDAPNMEFETFFTKVKESTGQYELSFCSKVQALKHPEYPILDKYLLDFFKMKMPYKKSISNLVELYIDYRARFTDFRDSPSGQSLIAMFNDVVSDPTITDTKKIDTMIWILRDPNVKYDLVTKGN